MSTSIGLKHARLLVASLWNNDKTSKNTISQEQIESTLHFFVTLPSDGFLAYSDLLAVIRLLYIYLEQVSDISLGLQSQIHQLLVSVKQSALTSTTLVASTSAGTSTFEDLSDIIQKLQIKLLALFVANGFQSMSGASALLLALLDVLVNALSHTVRISRNNKKVFTRFCHLLLADSLKMVGYLSSVDSSWASQRESNAEIMQQPANAPDTSHAMISKMNSIICGYQDLWTVCLFSDPHILDSLISYQFPTQSGKSASGKPHVLAQSSTSGNSALATTNDPDEREVETEQDDVVIQKNDNQSKKIGVAYFTLFFDVMLETIPQLEAASKSIAPPSTTPSNLSSPIGYLYSSMLASAKRQFVQDSGYHDFSLEKSLIGGTANGSSGVSHSTVNSEKKIQYYDRVLQLFFLFYKMLQVSEVKTSDITQAQRDVGSNSRDKSAKRAKLNEEKQESGDTANDLSIVPLWTLRSRNSLLALLTREFSNSIPYHKSLLGHQQRLQDLAKEWIIQSGVLPTSDKTNTATLSSDRGQTSVAFYEASLALQLEAVDMLMQIDHRTVLSLKDLLPSTQPAGTSATAPEVSNAKAKKGLAKSATPTSTNTATNADGVNPMYLLLEILIGSRDGSSIIIHSAEVRELALGSGLLAVKKRVLCRVIETLAKLQRVPELVRYILRSTKSWIPTSATHAATDESSSVSHTIALIEHTRGSILRSVEVQRSLTRAFDGLQTVQHPPVWNVLIDLCYFKVAREEKSPAEYLAAAVNASASGGTTASAEPSTSTDASMSKKGQVNSDTSSTPSKLNILNYSLCPILSAMCQSVGNSLHTIVLPETVLFRFFEKVIASSEPSLITGNDFSAVVSASRLVKNELLIPLTQFMSVTLTHTYSEAESQLNEKQQGASSWPSVIDACAKHLNSVASSLTARCTSEALVDAPESDTSRTPQKRSRKALETPAKANSASINKALGSERSGIELIPLSCTTMSLISFLINAISCCGTDVLPDDSLALGTGTGNGAQAVMEPFAHLDKHLLRIIATLLNSGAIMSSKPHENSESTVEWITQIQSIVLFVFRTTYLWESMAWVPTVMLEQLPRLVVAALSGGDLLPNDDGSNTKNQFSGDHLQNLLVAEMHSVYAIDNPILFSVLLDALILCLRGVTDANESGTYGILTQLPLKALMTKQVAGLETQVDATEANETDGSFTEELTFCSGVMTAQHLASKKTEVVTLVLSAVDRLLLPAQSTVTMKQKKNTAKSKTTTNSAATNNSASYPGIVELSGVELDRVAAALPLVHWYSHSEFLALRRENVRHPEDISARSQAFGVHMETLFKQICDVVNSNLDHSNSALRQHIVEHIRIALEPDVLRLFYTNNGSEVDGSNESSRDAASSFITFIDAVIDKLSRFQAKSTDAQAHGHPSTNHFQELLHTISLSIVKWKDYENKSGGSLIESKIFKQNGVKSASWTWLKIVFSETTALTQIFHQFNLVLHHSLKLLSTNLSGSAESARSFIESGLFGRNLAVLTDTLSVCDTVQSVRSFVSDDLSIPRLDEVVSKDLLFVIGTLPYLLTRGEIPENSTVAADGVKIWLRFIGTVLTLRSSPLRLTDGFPAHAFKTLLLGHIKPALQFLAHVPGGSAEEVTREVLETAVDENEQSNAVVLCLNGLFKLIPGPGRKLVYQFCQSMNTFPLYTLSSTSFLASETKITPTDNAPDGHKKVESATVGSYPLNTRDGALESMKLIRFSLLATYTSCTTMFDQNNFNSVDVEGSGSQNPVLTFYTAAKQILDDLPQVSALVEGNLLKLFLSSKQISIYSQISRENEVPSNSLALFRALMDVLRQVKTQSEFLIGLFLACLSSSKLEKLLGTKLSSSESRFNSRKRKLSQNHAEMDEILQKVTHVGRDGLANWIHFYVNKLVLLVQQLSPLFTELSLHSHEGNTAHVALDFVELVLVQLEHIFQLKMAWFGTSFGLLTDLCCQLVSLILTQLNHSILEIKTFNAEMTMRCFNRVSRVLKALADNPEVTKHTPFIFASILQFLSQKNLSEERYLHALLPGVFALLDKCRQRHRKQVYELLPQAARLFYDELYAIYLRDYKFGVSEA